MKATSIDGENNNHQRVHSQRTQPLKGIEECLSCSLYEGKGYTKNQALCCEHENCTIREIPVHARCAFRIAK